MKILRFTQFINEAKVNEAQIKDRAIIFKIRQNS